MRHVEFTRRFAAAHRIWNDESPCRNIHGHNYVVEVFVESDHGLNEQGFVVSFDTLKAHIDSLDHCLILDRADPLVKHLRRFTDPQGSLDVFLLDGLPSTENLAQYLAAQVAGAIGAKRPESTGHVRVKLTEGPSIAAWGDAWIPITERKAA